MRMGGVDRPCPWSLRRPMPGRRNASVKDPELYEELRDDGASKQKAARISNAAAKQALDRRPVASRGIQAPVAAARVAAQAAAAAAGRPAGRCRRWARHRARSNPGWSGTSSSSKWTSTEADPRSSARSAQAPQRRGDE